MNPHFRAEILAMTTAELAERNGAELLAQQLQSAARDDAARIAHHEAEVRAYIAANRGGLAVYWLAHQTTAHAHPSRRPAIPDRSTHPTVHRCAST